MAWKEQTCGQRSCSYLPIENLPLIMKKKDAIVENDLVLVHVEERPGFFARVERIGPDVKPKWWRVTMLVLAVPVKIITWILDDEQIRGADFTMGGTPIRIEKVIPPEIPDTETPDAEEGSDEENAESRKARILSLNKK